METKEKDSGQPSTVLTSGQPVASEEQHEIKLTEGLLNSFLENERKFFEEGSTELRGRFLEDNQGNKTYYRIYGAEDAPKTIMCLHGFDLLILV